MDNTKTPVTDEDVVIRTLEDLDAEKNRELAFEAKDAD